MYTESRKLHLIEEVLNITDENALSALETVLSKSHQKESMKENKLSIYDFVGILTKEESEEMTKAIEETSETINPDDWR